MSLWGILPPEIETKIVDLFVLRIRVQPVPHCTALYIPDEGVGGRYTSPSFMHADATELHRVPCRSATDPHPLSTSTAATATVGTVGTRCFNNRRATSGGTALPISWRPSTMIDGHL